MDERTVFMAALEIETPAERAAYLAEACNGNPELRARVERLLDTHEEPGRFLDVPALEQLCAVPVAPPEDAAPQKQETRPEAGVSDTMGETAETPTDWADDAMRVFLQPSRKPGSLGRLDHYEVEENLGKGAFGVVFRAFDEKLRRVVAVKVLAPQLANVATARKRFVREAQAAAAIRDEHVVSIHAVEEGGPLPYLVMEFIAGVTLAGKMERDGSLELKEILRIGAQTALGLAAAHKQGLVHRDIKPANILLENGVQRVKITDFGLARAADDASLSQSGVIAGTPLYMSPEQTRGESLDQRSDLFSLGSVLYAMCTGHPAFRAGNTVAVIRRVCDDTPRPIRDANPDMTNELEEIVTRLMAKDPAARYQTATEAAESLGQHLAQVQQQGKAPRRASAGMKMRTSRRRMICVGLLLAALLGLAAWQLGLFVVLEDAIRGDQRIDVHLKGKDIRPAPPSNADAPRPAMAPFNVAAARTHQEAWAKHLGIPVEKEFDLGDGQLLAMILIPPGEFLMGTADEERARLSQHARDAGDQWGIERIPGEGPQHRVRITRPFWLGRYEVTVGQFRRFVEQTGFKTEAERDGIGGYAFVKGRWVQDPKFVWNGAHDFPQADNDPVVFVDWNDAGAFCKWLSMRLDVEFELPTEAKWEYACRAGTTTLWCGASDEADLREVAWFGGAAAGKLHPVGLLRPNAFGLYDMHGNVWEWCADWYAADHYGRSPVDDPTGALTGSSRVHRGGDWFYESRHCRSANRNFGSPGDRSVSLGFRLAAALSDAAFRPLKKD